MPPKAQIAHQEGRSPGLGFTLIYGGTARGTS